MQPLDFEALEKHVLILTVENLNPLSNKAPRLPVSTATVVVTVVNENEAPRFREEPIQIVVLESVPPGTLLKSNIAFDPDNSDLRYPVATKHEYCFFVNVVVCGTITHPLLFWGVRYEIIRDPERWLHISRDTGDITARRNFNMRSPHVKNSIYNAVVKVTGQ